MTEPPDDDLLLAYMESEKELLHAMLMALQARTWTECRAELMKALIKSHNGMPEPIPEDENVYEWRAEVVEEHLKAKP